MLHGETYPQNTRAFSPPTHTHMHTSTHTRTPKHTHIHSDTTTIREISEIYLNVDCNLETTINRCTDK